MSSRRLWSWIVFILGALYFLLPLYATFDFSIHIRRDHLSFDAYQIVLSDPRFQASFGYSLVIGAATIVVSATPSRVRTARR